MKATRLALVGLVLLLGAGPLVGQEEPYAIRDEPPEGNELVMVYMTGYNCAPSQTPEIIEAVKEIKRRLAAHADSVGRPFAAVGVSRGWDVSRGIEHLAKFGAFDELIVGRSWHNTAAVRYWHREFPAEASTPQIILTEQEVAGRPGGILKVTDEGDTIRAAVFDYGEEVLIFRAGTEEILEWAASGSAIPR